MVRKPHYFCFGKGCYECRHTGRVWGSPRRQEDLNKEIEPGQSNYTRPKRVRRSKRVANK